MVKCINLSFMLLIFVSCQRREIKLTFNEKVIKVSIEVGSNVESQLTELCGMFGLSDITDCLVTGRNQITVPRYIPRELYDEFTLGGLVPVYDLYFNDKYSSSTPIIFTTEKIEEYTYNISQKQSVQYDDIDPYLFELFDNYKSFIAGKIVGVIGSRTCFYESLVLYYGGNPITVEYNTLNSQDSRIKVLTVAEYNANPIIFDIIISISSLEHDGLGRYGDPIDPWGDIKTMKKFRKMIQPDGLLFLAIPVGEDAILWNANRIYGALRLPLLLSGWNKIDVAHFNENNLYLKNHENHSIFVLKPMTHDETLDSRTSFVIPGYYCESDIMNVDACDYIPVYTFPRYH